MNTNDSNPKTNLSKESYDKQLDAIAKLAIVSLTWSLADLSKKNRTNTHSDKTDSEIHINLSRLKDGLPSPESPP
jgi:hypothetical protein